MSGYVESLSILVPELGATRLTWYNPCKSQIEELKCHVRLVLQYLLESPEPPVENSTMVSGVTTGDWSQAQQDWYNTSTPSTSQWLAITEYYYIATLPVLQKNVWDQNDLRLQATPVQATIQSKPTGTTYAIDTTSTIYLLSTTTRS